MKPEREMTPDYWCTWENARSEAKEYYAGQDISFLSDEGAKLIRNLMTENRVFGKDGWIKHYPEIRDRLYFLLDDGWDVEFGIHPDKNRDKFGSLMLSETRFPSFKGEPKERLKEINERVKAAGWRGLGIWCSAQCAGKLYGEQFGDRVKEYWKERVEWSKYAGVEYWKVDWGKLCENLEFRRYLSEIAAEIYPQLQIEHAVCMNPVHGNYYKDGCFCDSEYATAYMKTAEFSEIFRSYDVLEELSVASTLGRVAYLLSDENVGLINCEDEPYIGAVLGCAIGIMRGRSLRSDKMDECVAAVNWHKVAPAFVGGKLKISDKQNKDFHLFQDGSTWFDKIINKTVYQSAPSVIARNTDLPLLTNETEDNAFVAAAKQPNGAYSIGAFPRMLEKTVYKYPSVSCCVGNAKNIGIFGIFEELRLEFSQVPFRLSASNAARGEKYDYTHLIKNNIAILDKKFFLTLKSEFNDNSDSAVVLCVEY